MRIAVISAFFVDSSVGGAENHIRFMCKQLSRQGHETVVFRPVSAEAPGAAVVDGISVVRVGGTPRLLDLRRFSGSGMLGYGVACLRKLLFSTATLGLCREVSRYDPDVVWQHDFLSSWAATRLLSRRYPVVLTNHQGQYLVLRRRAVTRWLLRFLLKHYAAIIGPSAELTPSDRSNCYTIYNGVDTEIFRPVDSRTRIALRRQLLEGFEGFVVFCPRRWAPTKGVIYFVEALRILGYNRPDLASRTLAVFAGNEYREYVRYASLVRERLRSCGVRFLTLGDLDVYEMVSYYQCADLVVIPSLLEAVSLAALEAMACGTAVLATAVGGMPEVIVDGETGFLVQPACARALADALVRAIENEPLRARIAQAGMHYVRESFSWEAVADRTVDILCEAVRAFGRARVA